MRDQSVSALCMYVKYLANSSLESTTFVMMRVVMVVILVLGLEKFVYLLEKARPTPENLCQQI